MMEKKILLSDMELNINSSCTTGVLEANSKFPTTEEQVDFIEKNTIGKINGTTDSGSE